MIARSGQHPFTFSHRPTAPRHLVTLVVPSGTAVVEVVALLTDIDQLTGRPDRPDQDNR
jgi:hypothetical protein